MEGNGGPLNTYDPNSWIRLEDKSGRVSTAPVDGEPTFRDVADSPERSIVSRDGLRQGVERMRGDVEDDFEITIKDWRDIVGPNNGLDVAGDDLSDFTIQIDGLDKEAEDCVIEWEDAIRQIDDDEEIDFGPRGPKEPVKETSEPSPRVEDDGGRPTKLKRDKEDEPEITIDPEDTTLESDVDAEADVTLDQPVGQTETVDDTTTAETTAEKPTKTVETTANPRITEAEKWVDRKRQWVTESRANIADLTNKLQDSPDDGALKRSLDYEVKSLKRFKRDIEEAKQNLIALKKDTGEDISDYQLPESGGEDDDDLLSRAEALVTPPRPIEAVNSTSSTLNANTLDARTAQANERMGTKLSYEKASDELQTASSVLYGVDEKFGLSSNIVVKEYIDSKEILDYGRTIHYLGTKMKERSEVMVRGTEDDVRALDDEINAIKYRIQGKTEYYKGAAFNLSNSPNSREQAAGEALTSAMMRINEVLGQ